MTDEKVISREQAQKFMEKYIKDMAKFKSFGDYMRETMTEYEKEYEEKNDIMETMSKREKNTEHILDFQERTGLSYEFYTRVKKHSYRQPSMRTFMSLIMGYGLGMETALLYIQPIFRSFDITNKVHRAYIQLIMHHEGKNFKECNKVLKGLGIAKKDYLGTHINTNKK